MARPSRFPRLFTMLGAGGSRAAARSRRQRHRPLWCGEPLEHRAVLAAGVLDASFGSAGKAVAAFDLGGANSDWAQAMAVDSSGRTVVVGRARHVSGNDNFAVARFLANGRLDTTFSGDGKTTVGFNLGGSNKDEAYAVKIDAMGRIVIAGYAETGPGDYDFAVTRLLPTGVFDTSFGRGGKATVPSLAPVGSDDRVSGIAIDGQGRIVLVGQTIGFNGDKDFAIVRLTAAGNLDGTFGVAGTQQISFSTRYNDWASAVTLDAQGRIVVAGTVAFGSASNSDHDFAVARLLPTGGLDTSFGSNGKKTIAFDWGGQDGNVDAAADVKVDRQGRIVIAGTANVLGRGEDFAVARLLSTGQLDTSFNYSGKTAVAFDYGGTKNDRGRGLQIDASGRILVVGTVTRDGNGDTDLAVLRLTSAGVVDTTFGSGNGKAIAAFDHGGTVPVRNADLAAGIGLDGMGRIIVAGTAKRSSDPDWDFVAARFLG